MYGVRRQIPDRDHIGSTMSYHAHQLRQYNVCHSIAGPQCTIRLRLGEAAPAEASDSE